MASRFIVPLLWLLIGFAVCSPFSAPRSTPPRCKKTKVAVLGAGAAGIAAAQALSDGGVSDFLILEYTDQIGGRCRSAKFGKDAKGDPYTVELGANWVQGLRSSSGEENPIWTLVKKYKVANYFSNFSSILTYGDTGFVDYSDQFSAFGDAYSIVEQDSGYNILQNLQDRSFRAGLRLAGWKSEGDAHAQAVEWYQMDYEYAQTPDVSSQTYTIANYNLTYYDFSADSNFVIEPRGFSTFLRDLASEFLLENDTRLLLNTVVTNVTWSDTGTIIYNADGSCIEADYSVTSFSIGVLQSGDVAFSPSLPPWKTSAISTFQMGTYTKIFLQFPPTQVFWPTSHEFFLYASPQRGYYPVFQSLDHTHFLPGSGILFVTVVTDQSYVVDHQSDAITKAEILAVLRRMFGVEKVPEPLDFMYPHWSTTPWAYGSYSNWPPGLTLEGHQNLRANVGRLWFAGEATSAEFYGYLQGAYIEGMAAGKAIAKCLKARESRACENQNRYEVLHGTTMVSDYSAANGWFETSFVSGG